MQTDEADGNDYLVVLDGYPLAGQVSPTGERIPLDADGVRLLSPVIPSKVYGLAKNYEAHAQYMYEQGQSTVEHAPEDMVIFMKPSTSVIGPDDPIVYPPCSHDMNFEPEVAVVIGRIAKNVSVEHAMDVVLGFTCVNDVTLRDLQQGDPMWTRAKGFDTSCPLGPWLVTKDEFDWRDAAISFTLNGELRDLQQGDPMWTRAKGFDTSCPLGPWLVTKDEFDWRDAAISFTLNGEVVEKASGTTANLIHDIPSQIAFISSFSTLLPGDVILTGTPDASGSLVPGDEAVVHVEGIGDLRNCPAM